MKIKFDVNKFLIKPLLATAIMCLISYLAYLLLVQFISWKLSAIVAIILAVPIYALAVAIMKILDKEEIYRLPKGELIYKLLVKMKLYPSEVQ